MVELKGGGTYSMTGFSMIFKQFQSFDIRNIFSEFAIKCIHDFYYSALINFII